MKFRNGNILDLLAISEGKTLVCCSTENLIPLEDICERFLIYDLWDRIDVIVSTELSGINEIQDDGAKVVASFEAFLNLQGEFEYVLFFVDYNTLNEFVIKGFHSLIRDEEVLFYIGHFVTHNPPDYVLPPVDFTKTPLIPKVIHYCWFGGNPLSQFNIKIIESWKRFCPDYEIIQWNEDNYDVSKNRFMLEAHHAKKWAFVSDYARLDILHEHGGIYMDTDAEVLKPLDRFLYDKGFCPTEGCGVAALGTGGAVAGHEVVREWLEMYENMSFYQEDGSLNEIAQPQYLTAAMRKYGLEEKNSIQVVNGMTFYPTDVFTPLHPNSCVECFTEKTHGIHHYTWSWDDKSQYEKKWSIANHCLKLLLQFSDDVFVYNGNIAI